MTEAVSEGPARADPIHARVVVLDTNMSGGKGDFSESWVRGLAGRLGGQGVELWVPQVVLWEWAEHAAATQEGVLPGLRKLDRLNISGLPAAPTKTLTTPEIAAAIEANLQAMPNVEVVPVGGESAIAALKDQVLLTGPGDRKEGVKTGAADSALVRDSVERIGRHRLGELAILSANVTDMRKTLGAIPGGPGVGVFAAEKVLMDGLASSRAEWRQDAERRRDSAEVLGLLAQHFRSEEQELLAGNDGHGMPTESWATDLITDIGLAGLPGDARAQFEQITSVQVHPNTHVVGISGVDTDHSETEDVRYATFDLIVDTVVQIEGYTVDGRDGSIYPGSDDVNTLLEVGCVAELRGTDVVDVRQVDTAVASDLDLEFSDELDAQDWLVDYLCALTSTRVRDAPDAGYGRLPARSTLVTPSGQVVASVHFEEPSPDASAGNGAVWAASFAVGPGEDAVMLAGIECLYDASAEVWMGEDESYRLDSPYRLNPGGAGFVKVLAQVADAAAAAELIALQEDTDE